MAVERMRTREDVGELARELLVNGWPGFGAINWSADGKTRLVVSSNLAGETTLLNVNLDGGVTILNRGSNPQIGLRFRHRMDACWRYAKIPVRAMFGWSKILDPLIRTEP